MARTLVRARQLTVTDCLMKVVDFRPVPAMVDTSDVTLERGRASHAVRVDDAEDLPPRASRARDGGGSP